MENENRKINKDLLFVKLNFYLHMYNTFQKYVQNVEF